MNWILLLIGLVMLLFAYIAMKPLDKVSNFLTFGIVVVGIVFLILGFTLHAPEPYTKDDDEDDD